MRELKLAMSMSLDGFVSGPDGDAQWIFDGEQEAIAWKVANSWNASLIIMGSRFFEAMAPFWPTSTMAFASPMNQIPKAVFSKQAPAVLKAGATKALEDALAQAGDTPLQPGAESWAKASRSSPSCPRPGRSSWSAQTFPLGSMAQIYRPA